ncbi:hypothetical protein HMPREF1052_0178 [Pasteurella bettyae CCUG 2042]|uniref:Uncharacterized protein n=1 Tax=Pasteurella bettyae CCUG 2042 TaxID=1095749 RepID=I3DIL7_9PAST|nr:hypothetical protein HMPREF1052_0178 [Pasteurella bettyae CCUG 2042]
MSLKSSIPQILYLTCSFSSSAVGFDKILFEDSIEHKKHQ